LQILLTNYFSLKLSVIKRICASGEDGSAILWLEVCHFFRTWQISKIEKWNDGVTEDTCCEPVEVRAVHSEWIPLKIDQIYHEIPMPLSPEAYVFKKNTLIPLPIIILSKSFTALRFSSSQAASQPWWKAPADSPLLFCVVFRATNGILI
jgi:hypothetical protein